MKSTLVVGLSLLVTIFISSTEAAFVEVTPSQSNIIYKLRTRYPELMKDVLLVRSDTVTIPGAGAYYRPDLKLIVLEPILEKYTNDELINTLSHETGHHLDFSRTVEYWNALVPIEKDPNVEVNAVYFSIAASKQLGVSKEVIRKNFQQRYDDALKDNHGAPPGWEEAAMIYKKGLDNLDFIYDNTK